MLVEEELYEAMQNILEIKDLYAGIDGKQILKGVNLTIRTGEVHAIMGPNGTGKSTLSSIIMGQPKYEVTSGSITLDGENLLPLAVDERARKGIFWLTNILRRLVVLPIVILFVQRCGPVVEKMSLYFLLLEIMKKRAMSLRCLKI